MRNFPSTIVAFALLSVIISIDGDVLYSDEHAVLINILSHYDAEVDDATLRIYTYDEGFIGSARMDANEGEYDDVLVLFEPPAENYYEPVRVVLQNDEVREVKHVWTLIG